MKNIMKNKKGFTLVELLAVIVVLAIVMVLATRTVLPLMNKAKVQAFATEAGEAIRAASDTITIYSLGQIDNLVDGNDFKRSGTEVAGGKVTYCFSIKKLVELGYYDKASEDVTGASPEYEGVVIIENNFDDNSYKYHLIMHNSEYYTNVEKSSVKNGDVKQYVAASANVSEGKGINCTNYGS